MPAQTASKDTYLPNEGTSLQIIHIQILNHHQHGTFSLPWRPCWERAGIGARQAQVVVLPRTWTIARGKLQPLNMTQEAQPSEHGRILQRSWTGIKDQMTDSVQACLRRMQCLPGSATPQAMALRGLAAIGLGTVPVLHGETEPHSLEGMAVLLREAGGALLERAAKLRGQPQRDEVCAALNFLSFRCFCILDMIHQVTVGLKTSAFPAGDAVWGSVVAAWDAVQLDGASLESALADLTRWWRDHKNPSSSSFSTTRSRNDAPGGQDSMTAALASIRQQAKWLRGESAGELQSVSAAGSLEAAADAVEKLRALLDCARTVGGPKLQEVRGIDQLTGLVCLSTADESVYSSSNRISPMSDTTIDDVALWAEDVAEGATKIAQSVVGLQQCEWACAASGLPKLAQSTHAVALAHSCAQLSPADPIGPVTDISIQLHCEKCWPLSNFLDDEAWEDVGQQDRERLCMRLLSACALAEACDVDLTGVTSRAFVISGVATCSVSDLLLSLEAGQCQVLLGACSTVWSTSKGPTSSTSTCARGVARDIMGTLVGREGDPEGIIAMSDESEHCSLAGALSCLEEEGRLRCMEAYALSQQAKASNFEAFREFDEALQAQQAEPEAPVRIPEVRTPAESQAVFRKACEEGDTATLLGVLSITGTCKVNVHSENEKGFRLACGSGHVDVVRALLALTGGDQVDVHAPGGGFPEGAFRWACRNGHLDVVRELLLLQGERSVDVHAEDRMGPEAAFRWACENGQLAIVRELLQLTGARTIDVHADAKGPEAALRYACKSGHLDVVQELLSLEGDRAVNVHAWDKDGPEAPFRWACSQGRVSVVRELLALSGERTVDVHADGDAAFKWACGLGHLDVLQELLTLTGDRAVNVHAEDRDGPEAGFRSACKQGHVAVVRELLALTGEREVNVHACNNQGLALAIDRNRVGVIRCLLDLTGERAAPGSLRRRAQQKLRWF